MRSNVVWDFDVYCFDAFREGYSFDVRKTIPSDLVSWIMVYENIFLLFPSVQVGVEDLGAVVFDRLINNQLFINFWKDGRLCKWWDFVCVSQSGYREEDWRRVASGVRRFNGVDVVAMWLSQYRNRSFGLRSASDVMEVVVDEVVEEYRKLGLSFDYVKDVEVSNDVGRYLQVNCSSTKFLYFLRSVARGKGRDDSYLCWFERRVNDINHRKELVFRVKRVSSLKEQKYKLVFECKVDPKDVDRVLEKGGVLDGVVPVLSFYIDAKNFGVFVNKKSFELVKFNLNKLCMSKERVNICDDEERDVIASFFRNVWKREYVVRGEMSDVFDEFGRFISSVVRAGLKKRVWVLCFGTEKLNLGDKVRMILPSGYGTELVEALTKEWIVSNIVHILSVPDYIWLMKVGLIGIDYNEGRGRRGL